MTPRPSPVSTSTPRPTKTRYWVVVFAITLAVLSYIDRVAISQAAPVITRDLGLTNTQMGWIFSAFAIAYAAFEVPGGWMGDWIGPRKVLMRIVIWWSAFTAATGYMWNFNSMIVTRFLFGAGEAGCFPNLTKAFSSWLPTDERARVQGIMWMSARWGGAFTPPLVFATFQFVSWRIAFALFGLLGVFWAIFFYRWYRDNPRDHKSVNEGELALLAGNERLAAGHGNVPWGSLIRSRTVVLLWIQYFLLTYPWYFFITWLPTFLQNKWPALSDKERAGLAVLPLFFGGIGCLVAGFISARVIRWTGSITRARRLMGCLGFAGAAVMIVISIQLSNPIPVVACIAIASFFNDLIMPGAWATCMDVGGRYAGTVSGSMNMMGNLAGFVAPAVGGILKDRGNDWSVFLYTMALAYLLGTFCWPWIEPEKPLEGS